MSQTYLMIKPELVADQCIGEIVAMLTANRFKVLALEMKSLTGEQVAKFMFGIEQYQADAGKAERRLHTLGQNIEQLRQVFGGEQRKFTLTATHMGLLIVAGLRHKLLKPQTQQSVFSLQAYLRGV